MWGEPQDRGLSPQNLEAEGAPCPACLASAVHPTSMLWPHVPASPCLVQGPLERRSPFPACCSGSVSILFPAGRWRGPCRCPGLWARLSRTTAPGLGNRGAGLGLGLLPSPREAFSASIQWPRSCPQVTRLPSNASLGQPRAGPVPLPGAVTRKHGQPGPLLCPFGRVLSPPAPARGLFLWGGITSGRLESWPHPGRLSAGRRTRRPGRNHQAPSLVPHRSPERPLGLSWDGLGPLGSPGGGLGPRSPLHPPRPSP